jgi:hypothetical protein
MVKKCPLCKKAFIVTDMDERCPWCKKDDPEMPDFISNMFEGLGTT